jgi:O-antigen/teichoic acid export membrane protein
MTASVMAMKSALRRPFRLLASVLSLRYFALRASTAGAAIVAGLVQTFVFARVLTPERFSIFILIGTFGVSLWLFDLGAAKILFVRQRARHLRQRIDETVTMHSSAVVVLYVLIVAAGALFCFAVMAIRPSVTAWQAVEYALFFSFSALNLAWFPIRNVSNAVDEFLYFETLEAVRRIGHIGLMLALLFGLPLPAFLILANLLWVVVFGICGMHLVRRGALAPRVPRFIPALKEFWHLNRPEILRSGNFAGAELTIYNFPYLVVPLLFGLGAPTIILDTVFKVFRGTTLIYAAGLDPLIPQQTRAFADRDLPTLKKATLTATVLVALPTIALCALLLFAGDRLFALLLGHAATVPREAIYILVVLLLANMVQNVALCLLQHTGFFREIARVASFLVLAMAAMTALVAAFGLDITGFLAGYAIVYIAGAILYIIYVVYRPFRIAALPVAPPAG